MRFLKFSAVHILIKNMCCAPHSKGHKGQLKAISYSLSISLLRTNVYKTVSFYWCLRKIIAGGYLILSKSFIKGSWPLSMLHEFCKCCLCNAGHFIFEIILLWTPHLPRCITPPTPAFFSHSSQQHAAESLCMPEFFLFPKLRYTCGYGIFSSFSSSFLSLYKYPLTDLSMNHLNIL